MDAKTRAEKIVTKFNGEGACLSNTDETYLQELIAAQIEEARREVDELFVLEVDCEFGSGCPRNNMCSGASHWLTETELRAEGLRAGKAEAKDALASIEKMGEQK